MDRKCKICQKPLRGRADMIFCSTHCKNHYHKHLRYASKLAAIEINGYLKRNYSILSELLGPNKSQIKVYRNVLEKKKFRFKYHTHFHINSQKKMFHYIYDLAWMEFSDDEILIVKKINIKTTSSQEPSTIKNQQSTINNQQSTITITLRLPRPELS